MITVYLDSQDFSRFSPHHSDYAEYAPLRRELIELKQRGLARFAFSDVHIWEALPWDYASNEAGLERVRTIAEFCGREHFSSASALVEYELRSLTCGYNEAIWPEWYPYVEFERPNRERMANEVISEIAHNRNQRRIARKAMRRLPETRAAIEIADEIISKYPFMAGGKHALRSYTTHRVGWDAVERALREGLQDIVGFSEWLVANWEHGQRFVAGLRGGNQAFQGALVQLFDKMHMLFQQSRMTNCGTTELLNALYAEQQQHVLQSFVGRCGETLLGDDFQRWDDSMDPSKAPSLFAALQFVTHVAYRSCLPTQPRNPRKHAGSDFADALHVLYVPKVDVFRADRFTCDLLRRVPCRAGTHLCPSVVELPALVKELALAAT